MPEFRLSFDNLREHYPASKYIQLLPTVSKHIVAARPMFSLDVTTVKIDPDNKSHVYGVEFEGRGRDRRPKTVALAKVAVDLLCAAADADVIVSERHTPRTGPLYAVFQAVACIRQPGGEIRSRTATVEWDGDLLREKLLFKAEGYVRDAVASRWEGKSETGVPWVSLDEAGIQDNVRLRFTRLWLDEREFGKRKAESKAARNALRSLLAMPSTFTPAELREKEFAVAKLVLTPDTSDPKVRLLLIQQGIQSQRQLWGATAAAAAGGAFVADPINPAMMLPAADQVVEPADEPDGEFHAAQAAPAPEPEPEPITWEQAMELVPEIVAITSSWPGPAEKRAPLVARFQKAYAARDAADLARVHNYCLDVKLAAEDDQKAGRVTCTRGGGE